MRRTGSSYGLYLYENKPYFWVCLKRSCPAVLESCLCGEDLTIYGKDGRVVAFTCFRAPRDKELANCFMIRLTGGKIISFVDLLPITLKSLRTRWRYFGNGQYVKLIRLTSWVYKLYLTLYTKGHKISTLLLQFSQWTKQCFRNIGTFVKHSMRYAGIKYFVYILRISCRSGH